MDNEALKTKTGLTIKTLTTIAEGLGLSGIDQIDDIQVERILRIKQIHKELTAGGMSKDEAIIPSIEALLQEETGGIVVRSSTALSDIAEVEEQIPSSVVEDINSLTTELSQEGAEINTKDFISGAVAGAFEAANKMTTMSAEDGRRYAEGLMLQKRIAALHDPSKAQEYHDFFLQAVNQQREGRKT
jgi:hypothetical protein